MRATSGVAGRAKRWAFPLHLVFVLFCFPCIYVMLLSRSRAVLMVVNTALPSWLLAADRKSTLALRCYVFLYFAAGEVAKYCDRRVCLFVCLVSQERRVYISANSPCEPGARLTKCLTTILRLSCDNDKVTIDLQFTKHLTNDGRFLLGTIHLQDRKIV